MSKKKKKKPPFPNPFLDLPDKNDEIPVDALGIPILEDVVGQTSADEYPESTAVGQDSADYDALLAVTREHLRSQLEYDLGQIIETVLPEAVANATRNLESEIRRELQQRLEERISELVDQTLQSQLNGPHE